MKYVKVLVFGLVVAGVAGFFLLTNKTVTSGSEVLQAPSPPQAPTTVAEKSIPAVKGKCGCKEGCTCSHCQGEATQCPCALEKKTEAVLAPQVPKDPYKRTCGCTDPTSCACTPGFCDCKNCQSKPKQETQIPPKPACCTGEGWQYNATTGQWWRIVPANELPQAQPQQFYAPVFQPAPAFRGGFSGGSCRGGG